MIACNRCGKGSAAAKLADVPDGWQLLAHPIRRTRQLWPRKARVTVLCPECSRAIVRQLMHGMGSTEHQEDA